MGRLRVTFVILVIVALLGTACDSHPENVPSVSPAAPSPAAAPSGSLSLLTEPDQGLAPIDALVAGARRSIDLTMYELVDARFETALVTAVRRGVAVRVVLDVNREKSANEPAFDTLRSVGAHVVWADARYASTHEKAMVVDDDVAVVMTLNLTSRYYSSTRDFAVLDRDPVDVTAIEQVFAADFGHTKITAPAADDLIWSPGSQRAVLSVIASARRTLAVENEEMASTAVIRALAAAAGRGVAVSVVMTDQSDWHAAFTTLARAGVKVSVLATNAPLYIHAKVLIADAGTPSARAFIGSENFSTASFDRNRELGIVTADPSVIGSLADTLRADATGGIAWSADRS
jgi:cardiolipin synthase